MSEGVPKNTPTPVTPPVLTSPRGDGEYGNKGGYGYSEEGYGSFEELLSPHELELTHSPSHSRKYVQRLYSEIKEAGKIQEPIKYVEFNGRKYIVEGTHRALIAEKLGLKLPAYRVHLPYREFKTPEDLFGNIRIPGFWKWLK